METFGTVTLKITNRGDKSSPNKRTDAVPQTVKASWRINTLKAYRRSPPHVSRRLSAWEQQEHGRIAATHEVRRLESSGKSFILELAPAVISPKSLDWIIFLSPQLTLGKQQFLVSKTVQIHVNVFIYLVLK